MKCKYETHEGAKKISSGSVLHFLCEDRGSAKMTTTEYY